MRLFNISFFSVLSLGVRVVLPCSWGAPRFSAVQKRRGKFAMTDGGAQESPAGLVLWWEGLISRQFLVHSRFSLSQFWCLVFFFSISSRFT